MPLNELIVSQGDFEKLVQKISAEKDAYDKKIMQELTEEKRFAEEMAQAQAAAQKTKDDRRNLGKSIMSVYYFLRIQFGLPPRVLSKEEFQTAEAELKKIAEERLKTKGLAGLFGFIQRRRWRYYLSCGYFSDYRTPFGNWAALHPFFSDVYESYGNGMVGLIGSGFDPDDIKYNKLSKTQQFSVPPNFSELLNELWEERRRSFVRV